MNPDARALSKVSELWPHSNVGKPRLWTKSLQILLLAKVNTPGSQAPGVLDLAWCFQRLSGRRGWRWVGDDWSVLWGRGRTLVLPFKLGLGGWIPESQKNDNSDR